VKSNSSQQTKPTRSATRKQRKATELTGKQGKEKQTAANKQNQIAVQEKRARKKH
jgi:hypothetical protein